MGIASTLWFLIRVIRKPSRIGYPCMKAAAPLTSNEDYVANQPMGEGAGIFPGRVVWDWNPDATDENCTNIQDDAVRGEDGYFMAKNNDQDVIYEMLKNVVTQVTGAYDVHTAWNKLFTFHNQKTGLGDLSYQDGQKIFIKINQNGGGWLTNNDDLSFIEKNWTEQYYGMAETSPGVVISNC